MKNRNRILIIAILAFIAGALCVYILQESTPREPVLAKNISDLPKSSPEFLEAMVLNREASSRKVVSEDHSLTGRIMVPGLNIKPQYFRYDLSLTKEGALEFGLSDVELQNVSKVLSEVYDKLRTIEEESVKYIESEDDSYCLLEPLGEKIDGLINHLNLMTSDFLDEEKATLLTQMLSSSEQILEARDKYREIAVVVEETRIGTHRKTYSDPTLTNDLSEDDYTMLPDTPLNEVTVRYSHIIDFSAAMESYSPH